MRVLVVEDDARLAAMVRAYLAQAGFEVAVADDAASAWLAGAIGDAVWLERAVALLETALHTQTTTPLGPLGNVPVALRELGAASRDPGLRSVLAFLALWSFSPGYGAVHDYHLTRGLGLPEALYGDAAEIGRAHV